MPFQPGQPRPEASGRKKGTPNKSSLSLANELGQLEIKPVEEILKLMGQVPPAKQLDAWLKILAYCYPTLKAVEHSLTGADDDEELKKAPLQKIVDYLSTLQSA